MHRLVLAITCLLGSLTIPLVASSCFAQDDVAGTLSAYYKQPQSLDLKAALARLAKANTAQAKQAAAWLRALLAQAIKDEKSGDAPWQATPFFGGGSQNLARQLRAGISMVLSQSEPLPAALPVLRWFLEEEVVSAHQVYAASALAKQQGQAAAALRSEVASRPHPNQVVLVSVLKQIAAAKETLPAEKLQPLCHHHRPAIREAARALNTQQGFAEPGPFDPVLAMRSPAIGSLMKKLEGLLVHAPPPDAPFIAVAIDDTTRLAHVPPTVKGWLIRQDAGGVQFFSVFGWKESISTDASKVARIKIEDAVADVESLRKGDDKDYQFSERGMLTGQFQGRAASLTELMLAQRLFAAGKLELAGRVLFPALATLYRDDEAVDVARNELGRVYGYRMLAAFAGDRDYQRAAEVASTLAKRYPETMFHEVAVGLAAQLPKRGDDFVKLKLPTRVEWAELKKERTRGEQIDFLCERMRLLNCFQRGQPSGIELSAMQFAEPSGMARNASWGLARGKTAVINPLMVLCGPYTWFQGKLSSGKAGAGRPAGMTLAIRDVPQLSKYLRDDWYIPTVTFFRDFHPSRTLHSTRPLFAHIINELAGKDLCEIDRWRKLKPVEIDQEIERIGRWAKDHAAKTPHELEWLGLEELVAKGATWSKVHDRVERLLEQKEPKAADVLKRYLGDEKTVAWDRWRISQVYQQRMSTASAAKDLMHEKAAVQVCAAVLVFRKDKSAKAREMLGDALEKRGLEWWTQAAVEALLAEGSQESRRQTARLFRHKGLHLQQTLLVTPVFRGTIMRKCAEAGMVEPYQYYLQQLGNKDLVPEGLGNPEPGKLTWAELHVAEIWREFGATDATVKQITDGFRTNAERLPELRKWLRARIAEIGETDKGKGPR